MERLKENLEKWSFIDKYRHLDDLCPTLDSIEEGCESLKHGKIIGASVFFYEAMEKLEFLRYCEKHGEDYVRSVIRDSERNYLDYLYEDRFYYEEDYSNSNTYEVECNYNYLTNKYLVSIDAKDISEFREKFYACLEHLKSIDFSEFDLYLNPNNLYADNLPNGCKEGEEFASLLNVFSNFIKENGYVFVEDDFIIESLLDNYKDRNYVYVAQIIKEKVDNLGLSLYDEDYLFMDEYDRMLCERRKCFLRFYSVACNLELKKID